MRSYIDPDALFPQWKRGFETNCEATFALCDLCESSLVERQGGGGEGVEKCYMSIQMIAGLRKEPSTEARQ